MSSNRHDDDMADVDIENGFSTSDNNRERNDSHVPDDSTSFDVRVRPHSAVKRSVSAGIWLIVEPGSARHPLPDGSAALCTPCRSCASLILTTPQSAVSLASFQWFSCIAANFGTTVGGTPAGSMGKAQEPHASARTDGQQDRRLLAD